MAMQELVHLLGTESDSVQFEIGCQTIESVRSMMSRSDDHVLLDQKQLQYSTHVSVRIQFVGHFVQPIKYKQRTVAMIHDNLLKCLSCTQSDLTR